jgi:hypothetical protein
MKLIAHGKVSGPCLSPSIKVWKKRNLIEKYKQDLSSADPRSKNFPEGHRFSVRIDFHLSGSRLQLSDLDNLSKTVLDGLFGTFGQKGSSPNDRFVWRLEAVKMNAENEEFTEFWIFDEGSF